MSSVRPGCCGQGGVLGSGDDCMQSIRTHALGLWTVRLWAQQCKRRHWWMDEGSREKFTVVVEKSMCESSLGQIAKYMNTSKQ